MLSLHGVLPSDYEQPGGCESNGGSWGNKLKTHSEDQAGSSQGTVGWGTGGGNWGNNPKPSTEDQGGSSNDASSTWGRVDNAISEGSSWGKSVSEVAKVSIGGDVSGSGGEWGAHVSIPTTQPAAWGKAVSGNGKGGEAENQKDDSSPCWGKTSSVGGSQGGSWGKDNTKDERCTSFGGKKVESSNAGQGGSRGKATRKMTKLHQLRVKQLNYPILVKLG